MRSLIVVTSWWSNCLALFCLRQLLAFAQGRRVALLQAGKSEAQAARLRAVLPDSVAELRYPECIGPDDASMRQYLAQDGLRDEDGVWFLDHDAFLAGPAAGWLNLADTVFEKTKVCLCTRRPEPRGGVTQPAYWLSPRRWPQGLSSFAPIPYEPRPYTRRPDLSRHDGRLTLPTKDTLVQVQEELSARGLAATFGIDGDHSPDHLLRPFPDHVHLGGLHLYTGPAQPPADLPEAFWRWRRRTLTAFDEFFHSCPPAWLAIEEPELLRRHEEMMRTLDTRG